MSAATRSLVYARADDALLVKPSAHDTRGLGACDETTITATTLRRDGWGIRRAIANTRIAFEVLEYVPRRVGARTVALAQLQTGRCGARRFRMYRRVEFMAPRTMRPTGKLPIPACALSR